MFRKKPEPRPGTINAAQQDTASMLRELAPGQVQVLKEMADAKIHESWKREAEQRHREQEERNVQLATVVSADEHLLRAARSGPGNFSQFYELKPFMLEMTKAIVAAIRESKAT
jgi:hypothetical protein